LWTYYIVINQCVCFACGTYSELIQKLLQRYGLNFSLMSPILVMLLSPILVTPLSQKLVTPLSQKMVKLPLIPTPYLCEKKLTRFLV